MNKELILDRLKNAIVKAIFTKGNKQDLFNHRPISHMLPTTVVFLLLISLYSTVFFNVGLFPYILRTRAY